MYLFVVSIKSNHGFIFNKTKAHDICIISTQIFQDCEINVASATIKTGVLIAVRSILPALSSYKKGIFANSCINNF